ncbi:hypothetical protein KEM52_004335, partial [Ascosphaera acerosa]
QILNKVRPSHCLVPACRSSHMGNKVSSTAGVRSPHFFEPGNAVNEIWLGDFELISHLPFGAPDIEQTGFQKGTHYPMIPWKPFLIPLSGGAGGNGGESGSESNAGGDSSSSRTPASHVVRRAVMPSSGPAIPTATATSMAAETSVPWLRWPAWTRELPIMRLAWFSTADADFACWAAMQVLAVLTFFVPIWLAVEMLVRAFESPARAGDEEESVGGVQPDSDSLPAQLAAVVIDEKDASAP